MNNKFELACMYAIKCHVGQVRKDGSMYIMHPLEVSVIASTMTNDEDILTAAVLHDVPEECDVDVEEIGNVFGERVGKIVSLETEPVFSNMSKKDSWMIRKAEIIRRLTTTDEIGYKIVFLSDKLSNIRSLYRDYEVNGINAFDKFHVKSIEDQAWFFYTALEQLSELKESDAYKEYVTKINIIFNGYRKGVGDGKETGIKR